MTFQLVFPKLMSKSAFYSYAEGFLISSIATPSLMLAGIADTVVKVIITALVGGFLGALASHFGRKLIEKMKW